MPRSNPFPTPTEGAPDGPTYGTLPVLFLLLAFFALFVELPPGAAAEIRSPGASEDREVTAAVLADWPPQYSLTAEGEPTGFAIESLEAVAERVGLRVRYRVHESFPDALDDLEAGRVDLIPNLGVTPQRSREVAFTSPLETFNVRLFVRAGSAAPNDWDQLGGRVVGVVRSNVGLEILESRRDLQLEVFDDVHSAVLELLAGHVDALVYPEPVIMALTHKAGLQDRLRAVGRPLIEIRRGIGVRPDDPELLARLERGVGELVGTPEYQEIYGRWYGAAAPFWTPGRVLGVAVAVLLVCLLGALLWRYRIVIHFSSELRRHREERQRAEEAAEESNARMRAVAENLAEGLLIGDLEGRITYVNPRFEMMTGYRSEECVGRHVSELLHPEESAEIVGENLKRRLAGISDSYETRLRTRDGGELWVEAHASPFVDRSGRVVGALSALIDVSERKRAQERLKDREEQLRHVQRIEALGRLSGGIAHDFNNLLTAINGYSDLLLGELGADDPRRTHVLSIRRAGESAASLTRQLLTFSRHRLQQPRALDLNEAVRGVEPVLHRLIEESIEVAVVQEARNATIVADPPQIESVLLNLAINARDAMPDGGRLTLRTLESLEGPEESEGRNPEGRWVVLEVEDTGDGMDEAVRTRIFDPFFTTKGKGSGTGLGLASVYGIVSQSGGGIEVESAPGRGSLFRVFFPAAPPAGEETEATEGHRPARIEAGAEPREVLLVVEDEETVRRLIALVLRQRGYEVIEAASGEDALRLMASRTQGLSPETPGDPAAPGPGTTCRAVDALVTDLVMPGIGGEELAARLRRAAPGLRVLFISGYSEAGPTPEELESPELAFLQKPFQPAELLRSLQELLAG